MNVILLVAKQSKAKQGKESNLKKKQEVGYTVILDTTLVLAGVLLS